MTEVTFKDKTYQIHKLKWGQYMEMLKRRKEGLEKQDEYGLNLALQDSLKQVTNVTDDDLANFYPEEIFDFADKIREAQLLPLQPKEKSPEQLSPTIQV